MMGINHIILISWGCGSVQTKWSVVKHVQLSPAMWDRLHLPSCINNVSRSGLFPEPWIVPREQQRRGSPKKNVQTISFHHPQMTVWKKKKKREENQGLTSLRLRFGQRIFSAVNNYTPESSSLFSWRSYSQSKGGEKNNRFASLALPGTWLAGDLLRGRSCKTPSEIQSESQSELQRETGDMARTRAGRMHARSPWCVRVAATGMEEFHFPR